MFGRKEFIESFDNPDEAKQPVFDWIANMNMEFTKNIQKAIEIRETIMKNSQLQRCLQHNIIFSIYCTICRKILCASCMYTTNLHRKHRVIPIENAAEEIKEDIRTFQSKIPKIMHECDCFSNTNSDYLMRMERQYNPIIVKIQQFYENLRQYIKIKEKQQMSMLKQKRELIRAEIAAHSREISKINQYVSEKYKSYANVNIKSEMLMPSRNILENLLLTSSIIKDPDFDYDKNRFNVDPAKIKAFFEDIIYRINSLIPQFEEKIVTKSRHKSIDSKASKNVTFTDQKLMKKLERPSPQQKKKRNNSSLAAGARTVKKY